MAQPTISSVIHHWKVNEIARFHVKGTQYMNPQVTLEDGRATWAAPTIEASSDAKNVIFYSMPTSLTSRVSRSSGALTITITNSCGLAAAQDVQGTYEK